jgi:predicted transcriptional regulator
MSDLHNSKLTEDLSIRTKTINIVELGGTHAQEGSPRLETLRNLITQREDMYPGIDLWFARKVVPGLKSRERVAFVAYEENRPIAAAILKVGKNTKFCHLHLDEDFRHKDIGQLFFTLMTFSVYKTASEIHFTLPESLWSKKSHFFESFGFATVKRSSHFYRHGDPELICSASFSSVWSSVRDKLSSLVRSFASSSSNWDNSLLMSVKPKYADSIFAGSKRVEIRKHFSTKHVGQTIAVYATKPISAIVGKATVGGVYSGPPSEIWDIYSSKLGCSKTEFDAYVGSSNKIMAIELENAETYKTATPLREMSAFLQKPLHPPQSFCKLRFESCTPLSGAVYLAELLQTCSTKSNSDDKSTGFCASRETI